MRVTAEQFNWRKENRITGAYEIKPVRSFRKGRTNCERCGLETEFLFDGFKSDGARGKFINIGARVRHSERHLQGTSRSPRYGIVARFARDTECIAVLVDGCKQAVMWHMDFWERVYKPTTEELASNADALLIAASVCQRCRPPSNLEAMERHNAARKGATTS